MHNMFKDCKIRMIVVVTLYKRGFEKDVGELCRNLYIDFEKLKID